MSKIFVFGSNLAGIHGAGAARFALDRRGAAWGKGEGLMGESYGLPTCNRQIRPLPLEEIQKHVTKFLEFAKEHPELEFQVTPVGCGLAGYKHTQIAPMFKGYTKNCEMPIEWNGLVEGEE